MSTSAEFTVAAASAGPAAAAAAVITAAAQISGVAGRRHPGAASRSRRPACQLGCWRQRQAPNSRTAPSQQ